MLAERIKEWPAEWREGVTRRGAYRLDPGIGEPLRTPSSEGHGRPALAMRDWARGLFLLSFPGRETAAGGLSSRVALREELVQLRAVLIQEFGETLRASSSKRPTGRANSAHVQSRKKESAPHSIPSTHCPFKVEVAAVAS